MVGLSQFCSSRFPLSLHRKAQPKNGTKSIATFSNFQTLESSVALFQNLVFAK